MQIPPDVAQNATELMKYGGQWFIDHLEAGFGDFVWSQSTKALVRTLFPKLAEADPRELRRRIERLEAGAKGMEAQINILREEWPDRNIEPELQEPAAQEFVVDSLAAMMESPSEEKREVLGRFVAERLYVETESPQELNLRQAESLTERMNRRHLYALATLYLVHVTPLPQRVTRGEIHAWMERQLLPISRIVADVDPSYGELSYLSAIGAVLYDGSDTRGALITTSHAPAIEQNIFSATGDLLSPVTDYDLGEFYEWARLLHEGRSPKHGDARISLSSYTLTPPGALIAWTVLESFGVSDNDFYDVG